MLVTLELENIGEYVVATLGIKDYDNDEYTYITSFFDVQEVIIKLCEYYDPSRPNAKWVTLYYNKINNQIKSLLIDEIHNNTDLIIKDIGMTQKNI